MSRDITNENAIELYMHCGLCVQEIPKVESAQSYARLEIGWTPIGFQVWCTRHNANVVHVDFEGVKHPANRTMTSFG